MLAWWRQDSAWLRLVQMQIKLKIIGLWKAYVFFLEKLAATFGFSLELVPLHCSWENLFATAIKHWELQQLQTHYVKKTQGEILPASLSMLQGKKKI